MSNKPFSRAGLTAACCTGYFVLGVVSSLLGVSLERFAEQISVRVSEVGGTFFFFIGIASFCVLFATGPLIDRYGKKPVLVAGGLLAGVAVLLAGIVASIGQACAVMFMLGCAMGCFNAGLNTLLSDLYPGAVAGDSLRS